MTMMSASHSNSGTETMNGHLCVGGLTRGNYLPSEGYFEAPGGLIRTVMLFRDDNGMLPNLTAVGKSGNQAAVSQSWSNNKLYTRRFTITPPPPPDHEDNPSLAKLS